jgi:hypothetical protein
VNFTTEKNKEVLTTTSTEGKTSFMVCNTDKEKNEKVCTDLESTKTGASENKTRPNSGEKGMLDNNTYNLLEQLNVENKSLWRIKNNYKNDASMDKESRQVWSLLEKDKQKSVRLLTARLKERL